MWEEISAVLSLIGGLLLFVLILFLAWFFTRWYGNRYSFRAPSGKLTILEQTALGPNRSLVIVRVEEKVWLLGVTDHHIERIGELDPEQFPLTEVGAEKNAPSFSSALQSALSGWTPGKKQEKGKQDE